MIRPPVVPLLTMLVLLPHPSLAQQEGAPPATDPVAVELNGSLRRVANALERAIESQRADADLKRIEVASRILQLHWDRISQLRNAADTAEKEAIAAEQNRQLMLVELDGLDEREREIRDSPEDDDGSGERRGRLGQLKDERKRLEAYLEQEKDRAWRLRDQASLYRSEMADLRSREAHLEAVIGRWLDALE